VVAVDARKSAASIAPEKFSLERAGKQNGPGRIYLRDRSKSTYHLKFRRLAGQYLPAGDRPCIPSPGNRWEITFGGGNLAKVPSG